MTLRELRTVPILLCLATPLSPQNPPDLAAFLKAEMQRSMTGYISYSVSADDGRNWTNPRPLLRKDHGLLIRQPLSCTPMYELSAGRYLLLHHDNDGRFQGSKPEDKSWNRRGNAVLWHPERMFFLLGKRITPEFLADLKVPEN